jgi:tellurite resistance protein TerC
MTWLLWTGFLTLIGLLLALDLGVLNRKPHVVSAREALGWTGTWIAVSLLFNALIYVMYENHWFGIGESVTHSISGRQAAVDFFTAYVVEKSLSLDNIFVMAMIFSYFGVPPQYQHRVLFWGILGALVMRGGMIAVGLALISMFSWVTYIFGGLLLLTAAKMLIVQDDNLDPEKNVLLRMVRRWIPVTDAFREHFFFVREHGRLMATPLFLTLALVESTDVIFAVDSIPAVFSVTRDPFIVFTSNVFAILGLRSLYFALAAVMDRFQYLKTSLVFLLAFIGVKMIISHHYPISTEVSLAMIGGILLVGVMASLLGANVDTAHLVSPLGRELSEMAEATYKNVRRVFVLLAGSTIVLVGAALLVLPGPGILTILAGLALLATEFVWAQVWMNRIQIKARKVTDDAKHWLRIHQEKKD